MVKNRMLQGCYTALALLLAWWIVMQVRAHHANRRLVNRLVDLAKDVMR